MSNTFFLKKVNALFGENEKRKIEEALSIAEDMHSGQKRRSGESFVMHPIAVADIIVDWKKSANMVIAALLHDTVEDSTLSLEEIERKFGSEVQLFVYVLTKDSSGEKNSIEKNLFFLKDAPEALQIKLADRLHNMRTIGSMPKEKRILKSKETLSLYIPIARALNMYVVADELKILAGKNF